MRQGRESGIPYEGHLSLALQRTRRARVLTVQIVEIARETDLPLPVAPGAPGGDRDRLRGVPVAGFGGAIRGTRPTDALSRLDREARALAVLGRDICGTSPGSDPVAELLRHEAETLELVRHKAPAVEPPRPGVVVA